MPPQQRRWGDHEGPPPILRQQPTCRRQEQAVDRRHGRTARLPTQDVEFVPQHDDFELFEVVRATAQSRQLQDAPKDEVP
jgi:hypothetical protein